MLSVTPKDLENLNKIKAKNKGSTDPIHVEKWLRGFEKVVTGYAKSPGTHSPYLQRDGSIRMRVSSSNSIQSSIIKELKKSGFKSSVEEISATPSRKSPVSGVYYYLRVSV